MNTVLVTGGSGLVGTNVVFLLLKEGYAVKILHRGITPVHSAIATSVEEVIGDIRNSEAVRRAVKGADIVMHTAAKISYWRKEREQMFDINIGGTRTLIEESLRAGVQKFVHVSSIAAIGYEPGGRLADETTPFNWEAHNVGYRISKKRAEEEVLKGVALGLPAVMVNPAVIVGRNDRTMFSGRLIADVYRKRIFYYPDGGVNIVDAEDVALGMMLALRNGRIGERYVLAGENISYKEMFKVIAEETGGIKPLFRVSRSVTMSIALIAEIIANIFNAHPWVTRELLSGVGKNIWFSNEKARRELGFRPLPFRETIRRTFAWFKAEGML